MTVKSSLTAGVGASWSAGYPRHYICDTEAELPAVAASEGYTAYTKDTKTFWCSTGVAWVDTLDTTSAAATFIDPSGADPAINSALSYTVVYSLNSIPNINPAFTNSQGLYLTQNSEAGQNVYSALTQSKRSFIPLHIVHNCSAAGQKFGSIVRVTAYGMGDSFIRGENLTYSGGPIGGDEGQGFTPVNYLQQQGTLTQCTISSIPTQSSANTTTTQAITKSRTAQAVTVASVTGISVNDWVVVGQEAPSGGPNLEAVKVLAVGAGTITGVFTSNHDSGTTITPALVMALSSTSGFGEQRVLVNLSGTTYSTGTIASSSGGALIGSGTTWANNMVGGGALNIGAISVTGDDFTGAPFSGGAPCKSWYQLLSVNSTTSIGILSFSVAGDQSYRGSGSGAYVIKPAARVLRIAGTTVICESSLHTWTVGNTLELAICPYPDVTGYQHRYVAYTRGGTYRYGADYFNTGARSFESCIRIRGNQTGADGGDTYGWRYGLYLESCNHGINFYDCKTTALFLKTLFSSGRPNANGTIAWDDPATTYIKPNDDDLALEFRPFFSPEAVGRIRYKDQAITVDRLYHVEHDAAVISSQYLKFGSRTVAQLGGTTAADMGAGAAYYCTNGNAGVACLAVSNGTNWKVIALGANISAS